MLTLSSYCTWHRTESGTGGGFAAAFSALKADEEREMKAELKEPGIYFVFANPKSFEVLPEYCEGGLSNFDRTQAFLQTGPASAPSDSISEDSKDPNTIIPKAFEEPVWIGSTQLPNKPTAPPTPLSAHSFPPLYSLQGHPRDFVNHIEAR